MAIVPAGFGPPAMRTMARGVGTVPTARAAARSASTSMSSCTSRRAIASSLMYLFAAQLVALPVVLLAGASAGVR